MKRPSFQFYPADWAGNSNLRRCTHAEKGIWLDVMCLMHDCEEYGVLRWTLKEIAQAVGCSLGALKGLVEKGVLKGADKGSTAEAFVYVPRSGRKDGDPVTLLAEQNGPIWYSSRMVRDEYVRTLRGESSRFGDANGATPKTAPKAAPKPPLGDGPTSSSTSSTSKPTSEANASGAEAPLLVDPIADAKKEIWHTGKALYASKGIDGVKAGKLLGQLLGEYPAVVVLDAVRAAAKAESPDPTSYLTACCQRAIGERAKVQKQSRHSGFDQTDYTEGVTADGRIA